MNENSNEINSLIAELDKIEGLINRIIQNEDFETLPKILEQRKKILEKMALFSEEKIIQDRIEKLLNDDNIKMEKIKKDMEKIKQQLKTANKGKIAIKNGYMKIQEEVSKRKFNSNG
ncbi:hypothetical protein SAMN02745164_01985 [Marinitoga hydrogenitolerans DSM 16785]|uniref:Flagellar protein FliT n=1 Tax=Marinitoga hydrogenitolerans (strain DSM 16785 / JCM 12826 / AT1271) TaxID=1122195 RepID=A0A1M4ZP54_MARH1|nr:hypothetical protein [Marinitoga hydrogenitolerans]SHF19784.1 hypothetical protein SAMN02745164_01985 [Marinitoga hydrogenitolerans DSM 16785]